jgi:hypothetical protein
LDLFDDVLDVSEFGVEPAEEIVNPVRIVPGNRHGHTDVGDADSLAGQERIRHDLGTFQGERTMDGDGFDQFSVIADIDVMEHPDEFIDQLLIGIKHHLGRDQLFVEIVNDGGVINEIV